MICKIQIGGKKNRFHRRIFSFACRYMNNCLTNDQNNVLQGFFFVHSKYSTLQLHRIILLISLIILRFYIPRKEYESFIQKLSRLLMNSGKLKVKRTTLTQQLQVFYIFLPLNVFKPMLKYPTWMTIK